MIEQKVYKCEKCGTTYACKADCLDCEKHHIDIVDHVEGKRFLPSKSSNTPYPDQILVKSTDGHKLLYIYKGLR